MIAAGYIILRFFHFASLLLLTGMVAWRVLLIPSHSTVLRSVLPLRSMALVALLSAAGMFTVQTILMSGNSQAIVQPGIWRAVAGTHFGLVWIPEMLLSLVSLVMAGRCTHRTRSILLGSCAVQLILTAMTGHAAIHDGFIGIAGQFSQAVHLLGAAFWCGGLIPLLYLMKKAKGQSPDKETILSMMKFSRYGHWAVALTITTGTINTLLIAGFPLHVTWWLSWLMLKVMLVMLMVAIALYNRYWLVPRFSRVKDVKEDYRRSFIRMTQTELLISLAVIALVSLFATLSPV